jgi:hypothetical protein
VIKLLLNNKKIPPIWKYSAIDGLTIGEIENRVGEMSEFEWEHPGNDRAEDFHIFFTDVSARAERLLELLYEYREYFYEEDKEDGFRGWNDLMVVLLGGNRRVLGWDSEELDYESLFRRGWGDYGEECAIEEASKRLERFTKKELIDRWHKVAVILTTYFELCAAYDGLNAALDYLENDGLTKSEELTRDIECAYNNLWAYDKYDKKHYLNGKMVEPFDKALEKTYLEMWCC